jgi:hypothetical protein
MRSPDAQGRSETLRQVFRWLLVMSTFAYLVLFFMPAIPLQLSPEMAALRAYNGYGAIFASWPWFPWSFLLMWLTASIGLFFFQNWARGLFAALYLLVLLLRLIQGAIVHLAVEGFLSQLVSLADGAILALAFTEPLASQFRRRTGLVIER